VLSLGADHIHLHQSLANIVLNAVKRIRIETML
jgi:hypothetical protein